MAVDRTPGFQVAEPGADAYDRLLVPAFFHPCAIRLLELAPPGPDDRVLDLAGGTGVVARSAAARLSSRGSVVVVDVNPGMIAYGSSRPATPGPATSWCRADAAELPLADASVNTAYCQQGVQFFPDPAIALSEVARVLVPGGLFAVAVWRSSHDNPAFADFVEVLSRHLPDHVVATLRAPLAGPDAGQLRDLLTQSGFAEIRTRIAVLEVRFASPSTFFAAEVLGSPLAGPVGGLETAARHHLALDVDETLAEHVDDDGLLLPMQTWLVVARVQ